MTFRGEPVLVTKIQIEAMPHKSLPGNGPGLGRSGMFSVEEAQFELVSGDGAVRKLELTPIDKRGSGRLAFDGSDKTAWQVSTARGRPITITLSAQKPFSLTRDSKLRLRLQNRTNLGCFRVLVTSM